MKVSFVQTAFYVFMICGYFYNSHASIMDSLREAVSTAEIMFGDTFKHIKVLAKKFKAAHDIFDSAVEENCVYKCPDNPDVHPVKNKLHTASFNGCGSLGMKIDSKYLPAQEMTNCCNQHDICYDTCNTDKDLCDLDFKRCLYRYCETYTKNQASEIFLKGCKAAAKMLYTGTTALGCKSYLDAQEKACYCPTKENKKKAETENESKQRKDKKTYQ